MFKVTNETFGEIQVGSKKMGYKAFIIVKEIDSVITELAENKVVKIKPIQPKTNVLKVEEKPNKRKNKEE